MATLQYELIIVTGCMRSGTSLLYALLSTSPDAGPPIAPARYIADLLKLYKRYTGLDRPFAADFFLPADNIAQETAGFIQRRLDAAWINCGRPRCLVIRSVDIAPMLPLVAELFPNARFIVSVRDPRDTITSILKVGRKQRLLRLAKISPAISRDIRSLCKTYNSSYLPALRVLRAKPQLRDRTVFVRYEDAARNPGAALEGVWTRLDLAEGSLVPMKLIRRPSLIDLASHRFWRTYITELHNGPASAESIGSHGAFLSNTEALTINWRCRHVRRVFGYKSEQLGFA